jgi:hypothetical protein
MPEKIGARQGIEPASGWSSGLRLLVVFEEQHVRRVGQNEDDRKHIIGNVEVLERVNTLHIAMVQEIQQDEEDSENEKPECNFFPAENQPDTENYCQQYFPCVIRKKCVNAIHKNYSNTFRTEHLSQDGAVALK